NRADALGLERAAASGIPTIVIESRPFGKDRAGFEVVLQRALEEKKVELICLGGFMRLFTAEFVQRWYGRMLNVHPSLLPSFPGLDPHGQALQAGVKISGATVHFVIPETDAGPIIMQGAVTVADGDTAETLSQRILGIEHRIYPKGKIPYIEDDGQLLGDSTLIRWHLEKKYGIDFDQGLSAEQLAIAWAFEKMAEDNLYWASVYFRWMIDANFRKGPANFFKGVPAPVRPVVVSMIRRRLRKTLHGQGLGRHSTDEITAIG